MEKIRNLSSSFAVFFGVAFATFASCLFSASAEMKPWQLGVPEPVSPVAVRIHEFHDYLLWLITAITIFVLALLVYVCVRFKASRNPNPSKTTHNTTIEVLVPDFRNKKNAIQILSKCKIDVFNHNLETVPSLYPVVRPGARYFTSLRLLSRVKEENQSIFTKSGIMVGMGETRIEVGQIMDDLRAAKVDFLTIGQYLQPSPKHHPLSRYYHPCLLYTSPSPRDS